MCGEEEKHLPLAVDYFLLCVAEVPWPSHLLPSQYVPLLTTRQASAREMYSSFLPHLSFTTNLLGSYYVPGAVVDPRGEGWDLEPTTESWRQIKRQPSLGRADGENSRVVGKRPRSEKSFFQGDMERLALGVSGDSLTSGLSLTRTACLPLQLPSVWPQNGHVSKVACAWSL